MLGYFFLYRSWFHTTNGDKRLPTDMMQQEKQINNKEGKPQIRRKEKRQGKVSPHNRIPYGSGPEVSSSFCSELSSG